MLCQGSLRAGPIFPAPLSVCEIRVLTDLALLGNRALQMAIHRNLVCFPSQAPVFGKLPRRELQWRLALLYFVRGWSTRRIAQRYGLTRERCGQIISDWRIRAVNMGYIQDVTPNGLDLAALSVILGIESGTGGPLAQAGD